MLLGIFVIGYASDYFYKLSFKLFPTKDADKTADRPAEDD